MSRLLWSCLVVGAILLQSLTSVLASRQLPLAPSTSFPAPLRLSALESIESHGEFQSFTHPLFPNHDLRIKKLHGFCDDTVNAYSGFLDITSAGSKHLYFWFFESRSDPAHDDVIMWLNGGPGGSSGLGAFMELGPCSIDLNADKGNPNRTAWNPYGWNSNANIFFLEQPAGVGFSYTDDDVHVYTTEQAAQDTRAFVELFFEVFEEFKGRAFHIAGESFGGRYIPLFASAIYDGKQKALEEGRTPVNLQSIMIGNGMSVPSDIVPSTYNMLCTTASGHPPVLDVQTCVKIRQGLPLCQKMMDESCLDRFDVLQCQAGWNFCNGLIRGEAEAVGLNHFDIRKKCVSQPFCYDEFDAIEEWMNLNTTRQQLGLDSSIPPWQVSSMVISRDFAATHDVLYRSDWHIAQLLERGVRVLIFVGVVDSVCSWIGSKRTFERLDWSGRGDFLSAPTRDWVVPPPSGTNLTTTGEKEGGNVAGSIRSARGLTWMTIKDAGHMVPYDKPREALEMLKAWLAKELV